VKLYLEEGLPLSLLSKEVWASTDGIRRWVKAYQERGEAGLRNQGSSRGAGGNFPVRCVRRLLRSRSKSHSLEFSGYPSIEAGVLSERFCGDGAADVTGRVLDCSPPEETFGKHDKASVF